MYFWFNTSLPWTVVAVPIAVPVAACCLCYVGYNWRRKRIVERRIAVKKAVHKKSLQEMRKNLKSKEIMASVKADILNLSFTELQSKMQNKHLLIEDVTRVYIEKALDENEKLNYITEPVTDAIQTAIDYDKKIRRKQLSGDSMPLIGIPVSIKENYFMEGYDSTGGMSAFLNKPAKDDGVLVKVLRHLGAIPFVRTNVPQSMMTFECSNPIYGTTINPYNPKRGPGGSSGGEGAIIGAKASILGWGSDIGGSLRIPSHFCGIYCLKPTCGRLSLQSCEEVVYGQTLIQATCGPMARDVDTLVAAMKAILCDYHFKLDPTVPPLPFNTQAYESQQPLRIGYYSNDGYMRCIPAVERGLNMAKEALEKMGHTLVPFQVPDVKDMLPMCTKAFFGDGCDKFMKFWDDDKVDDTLYLIVASLRLPRILLKFLSYVLSFVTNDRLDGEVMRSMLGAKSVSEWWQLADDIDKYKAKYLSLWKESELDAMLCPTMPYVAPPTGTVKYLLGGVTYTSLYNLLNYPAGCVPITKVTALDQSKMKDYPSNTTTDTFVRKYFCEDTVGLPVGVQCVALPFHEELVLKMMKDLETALKME